VYCDTSNEAIRSLNSNKFYIKKCIYVEIRGKHGEKTQSYTNSIIDKHQHMHFFTFNTVLV